MAKKKKTSIFFMVISLLLSIMLVGCEFVDGYDSESSSFDSESVSEESAEMGDDDETQDSGGNNDDNDDQTQDSGGNNDEDNDQNQGEENPPVVISKELNIHFLELGNQFTGDCTLIDVGDTEILIDAGSRKGSASTIKKYVDKYCTDGVLEYVIATHADQDHIAGFVGESGDPLRTGILYQYEVDTLIQFARTDKTTNIYKDYCVAVEYAKGQGTTVYTALECWNNANGAQRSYDFGGGITMNFLYQKYYEQKTSDENDYSVCMLLSQSDNHYLFTGDLEKKGEASLVESNELPKCKLFKGGHHGSNTSSSDALLKVIQPEIVCVCCCAGNSENNAALENRFPSQDFINRVASYTDKVYVTTMAINDANGKTTGYTSMNGNIVVSCSDGKTVSVNCSNNNTLLKDTDWFKANRTMPNAWKS